MNKIKYNSVKIVFVFTAIYITACNPCKNLVERPYYNYVPEIPKIAPSVITLPVFFTSTALKNYFETNVATTLAEHYSKENVSWELKGKEGDTYNNYQIDDVVMEYGIYRNKSKNIAVSFNDNYIDVSLPLSVYGYVKTDLKIYEALDVFVQVMVQIAIEAPELALQANRELMDMIDELADNIKDENLKNSIKAITKVGREVAEFTYKLMDNLAILEAYELAGSTISHVAESQTYFWRATESLLKLDFNKTEENLVKLSDTLDESADQISNFINDKTDELTKGTISTLNEIDDDFEKLIKDFGLGSDLAEVISSPFDVTSKSIAATKQLADETIKLANKTGKELKRAAKKLEKAGKKLEKAVKRCFGLCLNEQLDKNILVASTKSGASFTLLPSACNDYHVIKNDVDDIIKALTEYQLKIGCGDKNDLSKLTIKLRFTMEILKDYQLKLKVDKLEYEWNDECTLSKLWLIGDAFNKKLESTLSDFKDKLEKDFSEKIDLKTQLSNGWKKIQNPVSDNTQKDYFILNPESLSFEGISTSKDTASIRFQVVARPEYLINKLKPQVDYKELPDKLSLPQVTPHTLNSYIKITSSWSSIHESLQDELIDKPVEFTIIKKKNGREKIKMRIAKIKDFVLYGSGDYLVIGLCFKGAINGKLYVLGKPYYNEKDKNIYLKEVKFSLESASLLGLLNAGSKVFRTELNKMIEERVKIDYGQKVDEQIISFNEKFKNKPLTKIGAQVNAEILRAEPIVIIPKENEMEVHLNLVGNASIIFND